MSHTHYARRVEMVLHRNDITSSQHVIPFRNNTLFTLIKWAITQISLFLANTPGAISYVCKLFILILN